METSLRGSWEGPNVGGAVIPFIPLKDDFKNVSRGISGLGSLVSTVPVANPIAPPTSEVRTPRFAANPGPDWRVVSCRLIAVRNWRGCPPRQNVGEGYFASLGGAPLVSVMQSADLRYRNNGSAFR